LLETIITILLTLFKVLDVAAGEGDTDFVDLGGWGLSRSVVVLVFGDVTHFEFKL
jgi:hypothetical protein